MPRIVTSALIVAAVAVGTGATINTADWLACTRYRGGDACSSARNNAVVSWTGLGMNALALATNLIENTRP